MVKKCNCGKQHRSDVAHVYRSQWKEHIIKWNHELSYNKFYRYGQSFCENYWIHDDELFYTADHKKAQVIILKHYVGNKMTKEVQATPSTTFIDGSFYKIGAHGYAYRQNTEGQWIKSSMSTKYISSCIKNARG